MILQKKSLYKPDKGEVLDNTRLTQSKGYISAEDRINAIISAGKRLVDYRKGMYDFPSETEIPDDYEGDLPSIRTRNCDLVDAQLEGQEAIGRIKRRSDESRKKVDGKKPKTSGDTKDDTSDGEVEPDNRDSPE